MGSSNIAEAQAQRIARTGAPFRVWIQGRLKGDRKARIQEIPEFVAGDEYEYLTVLSFSRRLDDEFLRPFIHPTPFIFQNDQRLEIFKINFNPTAEQMPGLRKFLYLVHEMSKGQTTMQLLPTFKALDYAASYVSELVDGPKL